jgi:hypothetical protein
MGKPRTDAAHLADPGPAASADTLAAGPSGSALASVVYAAYGWGGDCVLGAAFGACTVLLWLGQRLRGRIG